MYLVKFVRRVDNMMDRLYESRGWQLPIREKEWKHLKNMKKCKDKSYKEYWSKCQITKEELAVLKEFKNGIKRMIGDLADPSGDVVYYTHEIEECRTVALNALNCIENMLITCQGYAIALRLSPLLEDAKDLKTQIECLKKDVETDEDIQNSFGWFYTEYANLQYSLEALHRRRPEATIRYSQVQEI